MALQGITTGTAPNDGTGDSLLAGAIKVNANFDEVYGKLGNGSNLYVGIVSTLVAGTNISITTSFGQVTVSADDQEVGIATYADMAGIATAAGIATEAVNCGLSTFATVAGVSTSAGIATEAVNAGIATYAATAGVSTQVSGNLGVAITGTNLNLSGITTLAQLGVDDVNCSGIVTAGIVTSSLSIGATYYGDLSLSVTSRWTLTGDGTDYTFTGIGVTSGNNTDPKLYLARNQVYEFAVTNPDDHPLQVRLSSGGGAYHGGISTYSSGTKTVTRFEIPMDAPNSLYYQCTSHSGMGNTITVYPSLI